MSESKPYRVEVFGKAGCDKCAVLNQRLDKLLGEADWQQFEKVYRDVLTEDGLVEFSEAECINPQRIPALVIKRWDDEHQRYEFVANAKPGAEDRVCKTSKLYQHLGLQTDYGPVGRGVITPRMLKAVLGEAMK